MLIKRLFAPRWFQPPDAVRSGTEHDEDDS
jgi:hypothetical protein